MEVRGQGDDMVRREREAGGDDRQGARAEILEFPEHEPAPNVFLHERVEGDPVDSSTKIGR